MYRLFFVCFVGLTATFSYNLVSFAATKNDPVLASVDKYQATEQEVNLITKAAGFESFDKLPQNAQEYLVKKMITDKVLEAQAKKENLDKQEDVKLAIRTILITKYIEKYAQEIENIAKQKYDEAVKNLDGKKAYTFYHILVKDKEEAQKIYKKLLKSGKDWKKEFGKLAKEKSLDEATAQSNGLVAGVAEMRLPENFLKNIQNANIGSLLEPFETNFGYHVVFVDKVEPLEIEPFENVRTVFLGQATQEQADKLAKDILKGKEIKFNIPKTETQAK